MPDLKPNTQEDKNAETASDSPGLTQEPLQSHTFSLKNNAAGLSSDEHENPLNGTQPNPFVYSSVPAVPHAGNSLPSGALVNGPGSHPTSEVHCVLNKGTVLSNNVLDAAWQAEKDTSPEVLRPPSELQSDAWKNSAGPAIKTLATQPGVNTPLSHPVENESKLAYSTLSDDRAEQMYISQPLTKQTIKTRSQQGTEWSESSLDDYDYAEVIGWDSARECFMHDDRRLETKVMNQRDGKHNTHEKNVSGPQEKVNSSLYHTYKCFWSGNDAENLNIADEADSLSVQSDVKYSTLPFKGLSRHPVLDPGHHISSTAQEHCNEDYDPKDEDNFSPKVEQYKTQQLVQDPLFFSCTICNVNFEEKRHFHRHMMYHLGKHIQVNSENVSQPFVCRECGRLFCDSNSLRRHIIIHQDRLEKLEEMNGLKNSELEDRATMVQCPQCVFGCNCQKIFVQHAITHDNLKHYYFCEECNYITLTQQALEAHLNVKHLSTHLPPYRKMTPTNDVEKVDHVQFQCKMGLFSSRDKVVLERHSALEHQQLQYSSKMFADQPKSTRSKPNPFKSVFGERAHFTQYSSKKEDKNFNGTTVNPPQFKCHVGCTKNMLSPCLWTIGKSGKLLLQPVEKLDVASDLTCVEEDTENNDCKAFGSSKQANCAATTDFLLSARNLKLDQMFCQSSINDPASFQVQANQHSPSVSKMSTPLHNTIDSMNDHALPKLSQRLKKQSAVRDFEKGYEGSNNFSKDTSEAKGKFMKSCENERNPYARRYFRKRQRFSDKEKSLHVLNDEDFGDEDCSDIEQLIIKEEYIEATVCDDSPESPCISPSDRFDVFPLQVVEQKPCPYCPAVFESGVGLSNHVRGHLHRIGLSYNARHTVRPEQVALWDHRPQIIRRVPAGMRKMRKVAKPETQGEYTCPLCCSWFDTRTGLSNHVRGHLKRLGRIVSSSSKSPLCILNELLMDKKEFQNLLQVLNESHFHSPHPILDSLVPKQKSETFTERKKLQVEAQRGTKASSSTLIELLKTKQESIDLTSRNNQDVFASRKLYDPMTKDYKEEIRMSRVERNWTRGECDSNKGCIHYNSTLPTAASLSAHLHTYTCRKRIAILEGPGYDYKQKKPRPRPGLKQKILPSLNAELYTFTCRFCDLVFQGPMSIQEDWIKHLQRHLLHTSVPHTGTGMVEILDIHH